MLTDKVVIVTGSTTGVGRAIATSCVEYGARVLIHGRRAEEGEQLAARLGPRARFHADDLGDPNAATRIVDSAIETFGKLDAVVNNAACITRSGLATTTPELFDEVMAVNVRAPLLIIRAAAPHLESSRGIVANIGSVNASGGEGHLLAYSVSKGALATLSKNLADALSGRVRFVHFNLGWVLTENEYRYKRDEGFPQDWPEKLSPHEIPSGKMTTPEQVAEVVAFWLSERARPFSGGVVDLEQYPTARIPPAHVDPSDEC